MDGRRGPYEEVRDWFARIPPVTRVLFTGTLLTTVFAHFGLVHPVQLYFAPTPLIFPWFQIWRLVTNFFIQKLGFNFLFHLYFLYNQSHALETSHYSNRTADYMWCVFSLMMILNTISTILFFTATQYFMPLMSNSLIMAIVYIWSMYFREEDVNFMYGLRFKAMYLPWALLALNFLQTGEISALIPDVIGIVAGHIYFFLDHIYPLQNDGQILIRTPQFLYQYFPPPAGTYRPSYGADAAGGPAAQRAGGGQQAGGAAGGVRYRWGSGQRLGSD
ncbi:hypothetical protein HDV00_003467 [Rhizophlyctis rosea]|nr:hypothetical protein HDV00_003467 [Rhizophlyctis rosea]